MSPPSANGAANGSTKPIGGPMNGSAHAKVLGKDGSPYGFPGAKFDVAFVPINKPEDNLERSRYKGFHPSSQILPKGDVKEPGMRALPCDIQFDRDVGVRMRDGVTLYTDNFRPVGDEKVPAILCWSPYGKSGTGDFPYDKMGPYNCGIDPASLSGWEKFEGPDPAEWVSRGYAIINIDSRGAFDSEGVHMMRWGPQEALDVHDAVDWVVSQPWSNGAVGMAGNSWLSVSQINAAARNPPAALKCIAPWEGHSDHYRDVMVRGGIPQVVFGNWMQGSLVGRGFMEDTAMQAFIHPYADDYWKTKRIPVEEIKIPTYVLGSYSSFIHTHGSFRTFREAKTKDKWIRVHNGQEWSDLYKPPNTEDLQRFFDRYLKGIDNGWERDTPRVRLTLLSFNGKDIVQRPEEEYPLARQRNEKLYLDAGSLSLSTSASKANHIASYESHHLTDSLDFVFTFDKYTEIAGYPKVKLWASCKEHDDMDIRVQIRKADKDGNLLQHLNFPTLDGVTDGYDQDVNIFKFLGHTGMLRASHRVSYNKERSTENEPFYDHDRSEPVPPGEIVPLEIGFWPSGMVFWPGEKLVLRIAGHSLVYPEFKVLALSEPVDLNIGVHNIHTGGSYDAHLLLPIIN